MHAKSRIPRAWAPLIAGAIAVAGVTTWCATARADIGIDVMVQNWDPSLPEPDALVTRFSNPRKVSDALVSTIIERQAQICDSVKQSAAAPNLLGEGYTLRNIRCTLGNVGASSVRPTGPWKAELLFSLRGTRLEAQSTQPSFLGSYADPAFSVAFDLDIAVPVEIHPQATPPIRALPSVVQVSNVVLSPRNFASDMIDTLGRLFGVDGTAIRQFVGYALENQLNARLAQALANELAQGLQALPRPEGHALKGFKVVSGNLRFAFVPLQTEMKPTGGSVSGRIRFPSHLKLEGDCHAFRIHARAQTKPREFRGFDVPLGPPEMIESPSYGAAVPAEVGGGYKECRYLILSLPEGTYTRLRAAAPNVVDPTAKTASGAPLVFRVPMLAPDGWRDFVIPQPGATANFELRTQQIPGAPLATKQQILPPKPDAGPSDLRHMVPGAGPRPPAPTAKAPVINLPASPKPSAPSNSTLHASRAIPQANRLAGYRSLNAPTSQQCQAACAGDAQCKSWTWAKAGAEGPQAKCWLSKSASMPVKDGCCVSGVRP